MFFSLSNRLEAIQPKINQEDRILIDKLTPHLLGLQRRDLVTFKISKELEREGFEQPYHYLRWVVGLPGELVEIKGGKVYINDELLPSIRVPATYKYEPETLSDNSFLLLGNNPDAKQENIFGAVVKQKEILGRGVFRYWPFNRIGSVDLRA